MVHNYFSKGAIPFAQKTCAIIAGLLVVWLLGACEKPRELVSNGNNNEVSQISSDCDWNLINPIILNESLVSDLNIVFSENNNLTVNAKEDTSLFVIDNQQDFLSICSDNAIVAQLDFANYCIVWGKVQTPNIPYTILDKNLFYCNIDNSYKYEVTIEKCIDCWTALGTLYYWEVYPKIESKDIILILK